MPGRTNTERIEEIGKQVVILSRDIEHLRALLRDRTEDVRKDVIEGRHDIQALTRQIEGLQQRLMQAERFDPSQIPVLNQRLAHLEKLTDEGRTRRWQVWLAVLGAILSAVIALIVALVKK